MDIEEESGRSRTWIWVMLVVLGGPIPLVLLIVAGLLALSIAIGEDNTTDDDMANAGFGGGLAEEAPVPDWLRELIADAVIGGCAEVTPSLLAAQLYQESTFNPAAQSRDAEGNPIADGIAQFTPGTWQAYGVDGNNDGIADVWDPEDAVPAAVAYDCSLADLLDQYGGDSTDLMLAGYNAGPGAVQQHRGIPPYEETRAYIDAIRERAEDWAALDEEPAPAGQAAGSKRAAVAIAAAREALGSAYQWGGQCEAPFGLTDTDDDGTPDGARCDCSSLTQMAWAAAGVNIPRVTYDQIDTGTEVDPDASPSPGDLLFTNPGPNGPEHVAMYIGGGEVIDAPYTGAEVRMTPFSQWEDQIIAIRHIG